MSFLTCLKIFDQSGYAVSLRVSNSANFRSACGGLIFLLYFMVALSYIGYSFWNFVQRVNFSVITYYQNYRDQVGLGNISFMFYTYINSYINGYQLLNDVDYFEIEIKNTKMLWEEDTNITYTYTDLQSTRCTRDNLYESERDDSWFMEYYGISDALCPNLTLIREKNIVLNGTYSDNDASYLEISLKISKKYYDRLDEVKDYFRKTEPIFSVGFNHYSIDYSNYNSPIERSLKFFDSPIEIESFNLFSFSLSPMYFNDDKKFIV